MTKKTTCAECDKTFEHDAPYPLKYCSPCADEMAMAALSQAEPPEGGWARGSDMDRL